jgi:hypothetical protein
MYWGILMIKLRKAIGSIAFVLVLLAAAAVISPASAFMLWYNGDMVDGAYAANYYVDYGGGSIDDWITLEDFDVGAGGWQVQSVFSNNVLASGGAPVANLSAFYEIRQGVSAGNGGTVVASGLAAATTTATGRQLFGFYDEYTVRVSGLSINLSPGKYWLAVYPDDHNLDYYVVTGTLGTNAIGSPQGNNGNSFTRSTVNGYYYNPTEYDWFTYDVSMGVDGQYLNTVPEPGLLTALGLGITGLFGLQRRRRNRD